MQRAQAHMCNCIFFIKTLGSTFSQMLGQIAVCMIYPHIWAECAWLNVSYQAVVRLTVALCLQ